MAIPLNTVIAAANDYTANWNFFHALDRMESWKWQALKPAPGARIDYIRQMHDTYQADAIGFASR